MADFGLNDWWMSARVNLLASGDYNEAQAKAFILTCVPAAEAANVATLLDATAAEAATEAAKEWTARDPASGWNYLTSSPMQTYEDTTP